MKTKVSKNTISIYDDKIKGNENIASIIISNKNNKEMPYTDEGINNNLDNNGSSNEDMYDIKNGPINIEMQEVTTTRKGDV